MKAHDDCMAAPLDRDTISIRRWFAFFGAALAAMVLPAVILASSDPWTWGDWWRSPVATFEATSRSVKLLVFAAYASLATTFLPLPTGWMVAAMATREASIASGLVPGELGVALLTGGIVGVVGAAASTLANLTDYHLFTWLLRNQRVARIRNTRTYRAAARWFEASPFAILVLFNFVPIPVDLVRILAATHRYGRVPFAAANFLGRLVRYGIIAFVTCWWNLSWVAAAALLLLALALAAGRVGPAVLKVVFGRSQAPAGELPPASGPYIQKEDAEFPYRSK